MSHLVVCWGELLWDLLPAGPRLGGSATNVACHVTQRGGRGAIVTLVGSDPLGHLAIDELRRRGVETSAIQQTSLGPTGTVEVTVVDGEARYRIGQRVDWSQLTSNAVTEQLIAASDVFCFGAMAQHTPLGTGGLARGLQHPGPKHRVCDLNLRGACAIDIVQSVVQHATVVKMNEHERRLLALLSGCADAAAWLLDHYAVQLVATTFGSRGCELRSVQHRVEHGGFASSGGDSVGAGDAFVAVLCQHLADTPEGPMHRDWLQTAAIEANRYGAFVASQVGAMSPLPLLGRTSVSGPEPG